VRHARQRIGRDEAVVIAGRGEAGRAVVNRLSGQRRPDDNRQAGPLRLITVGDNGAVNLIHETLIRSKGFIRRGRHSIDSLGGRVVVVFLRGSAPAPAHHQRRARRIANY
jgi:hypothetical protein